MPLLVGACTPIEAPDPEEPPPLTVGDSLPGSVVGAADDAPWELSELAGQPIVMTFLRTYEDAGRAGPAGEILARIDDALERLRVDVAARTLTVVVLLDGPDAHLPGIARPDWRLVDTPREGLRRLAARLGVLLWEGTDGLSGQTFVTVVVGPDLQVTARFPGIDAWTTGDLVGAIAAAGDL